MLFPCTRVRLCVLWVSMDGTEHRGSTCRPGQRLSSIFVAKPGVKNYLWFIVLPGTPISALAVYDSKRKKLWDKFWCTLCRRNWGSLLCAPLTVDFGLDWLVPWDLSCLLCSKWPSVVIRESLCRNAFHLGLRRKLSWVWQALILRFSWLIMKIAERLSHRARLTELNVSDGTYLMNVLSCFQKYGVSALARINAREWSFTLSGDDACYTSLALIKLARD